MLGSILYVQCMKCYHLNEVCTSSQHRSGKRGPPCMDANTRVVLGSLHAGIGHTHVNHLLSTMNVPTISHKAYKVREREVGSCVEALVKESCNDVICKEKNSNVENEKAGVTEMAASYDMGWQKRGKGHNSTTGHGAVMGLCTGKVMDYATRYKNCRFCEEAKAKVKPATAHDCRKNHEGSSKSMESSVSCELWNKAPLSNTRYTIYIGDDDTTTLSHMHEKVPYDVEKWSDITHAKRSLTTKLYNISQGNKFKDSSPLSQKVINYLAKCFSYCVAQNKGNPSQLKKSLSQIVPHAFGDHTLCDSSWCRFIENPATYTHNDLPHGKDLHGEQLKKVLTELFNEYCTDTVISKLAPCANSQRNESLNSVIGTKNPKTRYYGGSESSDFRVACGIAQVNVGYGYISNTLERLNIEPGEFCTIYVTNMDKKTATAKLRKGQKKSKYRRNQLRRQKNSKLAKSEKK